MDGIATNDAMVWLAVSTVSLYSPATGHSGMLSAAGILPADGGSYIMDRAHIPGWIVTTFQPGAGVRVAIGSRLYPDAAGRQPSVPMNSAHPFEDVVATQPLPAPVISATLPSRRPILLSSLQ